MKLISKIEAIKVLGVLDNSIEIITTQNKIYSFISFSNRDVAYKRITSILKTLKKKINCK
jgi:hypothetical protein